MGLQPATEPSHCLGLQVGSVSASYRPSSPQHGKRKPRHLVPSLTLPLAAPLSPPPHPWQAHSLAGRAASKHDASMPGPGAASPRVCVCPTRGRLCPSHIGLYTHASCQLRHSWPSRSAQECELSRAGGRSWGLLRPWAASSLDPSAANPRGARLNQAWGNVEGEARAVAGPGPGWEGPGGSRVCRAAEFPL